MKKTAIVLAEDLRKVIRFRYLTVDRHSVKLWKTRPRFSFMSRTWIGNSPSDWCGAVDTVAADLIVPLDFSVAIVEVGQ